MFHNYLFKTSTAIFMLLLLGACGGSGSGSGGSSQGPAPVSDPVNNIATTTISTSGGEYDLGNGISLSVPPGAVSQNTKVSLRLVPTDEMEIILDSYGETKKTVLAAVQSLSADVSLLKPISLSIPLESSLPPSALPFLMVVDPQNGIYAFDAPFPSAGSGKLAASKTGGHAIDVATSNYSAASLGSKYVQYDCDNNRVIIANITELPEDERALAAVAIEELRAESDCFDNPCRCCVIRTTEETLDVIREGDGSPGACYNSVIKGSVQFLSCGDGQLTESYEIVETSVGKVNLRPSELEMASGSGAMVSVDVLDAKGDEIEFYTIADVPSRDPDVASKGYIEIDQDLFQVLAHKPGQTVLDVTLDCSITESLPVTVNKIQILTDQDQLMVPEGGTSAFQVRLDSPPPEGTPILLGIVHTGGDPDILVMGHVLTFDESNWSIYQQVSLAAAEDDDVDNGAASISLSSESGLLVNRNLSVTEIDNDILQLVTSSGGISVPEGSTASFSIRLSNEPPDTVTISVVHVFGDTDISVSSGETLSFGADNWNTPQAVVLNAAEDDDDVDNGVATIRISDNAGQLNSVDVAATEADNDLLQLTVTPAELCIERGRTANLSVIGSSAIDLAQVEWHSSDESVALVGPTGIVTPQGDGPALISAQVEGAEAFAVVRVREHCFRVEPANVCLHAPIPGLPILSTNFQALEPKINTAMAGHKVSYVSSNESVVTIDATGTVMAHAGGDAFISASVDNVITDYSFTDVISVHVAGSLDEYRRTSIGLPVVEEIKNELFLTDDRNIYTQSQLVEQAEEKAASCGGFPSAPDYYTITDFNNYGEYIASYINNNGKSVAIYFNSVLCVFRELDNSFNNSEIPKAINDLGMTAIDVNREVDLDEDGEFETMDLIGIATRDGSISYPYARDAIDLNNNGQLLLFTNETDPTWWDDQCYHYYVLLDATMPAGPSAIIDMLVEPEACDYPQPMAINNHNIVLGNYQWGQYEQLPIGSTYAYYTYPDGMYLYYGGLYYDVPVWGWALDVNDSQDILAREVLEDYSDGAPFVAHVCPFTLETNVCDWVKDEDRQGIEGYEAGEEISCDGLDNDCDGLVDEVLVAPYAFKQEGVCAGVVQECHGKDGWVSDYSKVPDYEFPEVSCDGKDNDCDGDIDEGCNQ